MFKTHNETWIANCSRHPVYAIFHRKELHIESEIKSGVRADPTGFSIENFLTHKLKLVETYEKIRIPEGDAKNKDRSRDGTDRLTIVEAEDPFRVVVENMTMDKNKSYIVSLKPDLLASKHNDIWVDEYGMNHKKHWENNK